ncbi:3'-5' exonuclease [Aeromonas hydrophila]
MNDKAERYQGDTVVFDTETLAMDKKAVVLTLSAVRFNKHDAEVGITIDNGRLSTEGENVLHLKLNVTEQLLAGRTVDPGTVAWWNKQGKEARDGIINGSNTPVREALILLSDFMKGAQPFARGTDFDPPILVSLFEGFSLPVPWKYNQVRDVRTYIDALSGGSKGYLDEWQKPDWFVPHHSLHDCIRDAEQMQLAEGQVSRGNE